MFEPITTCYLFLGGTGGGALAVLSVLECARRFVDLPFTEGKSARGPARLMRGFVLPDDVFVRVWPVCFVVLAAGVLCLLFDVGRPDRELNLVVHPQLSAMVVGAYALAASLACAAMFSAFSLLDGLRLHAVAAYCLALAGAISGSVTVVYTGVLLQSLASVLFYQTPLLPILFALSSLSCGVVCVFLAAVFVESRWPNVAPLARLARVDGALIVLEAVCLALYMSVMLAGGDGSDAAQGVAPAAFALVAGDFAWEFWFGLVIVGLAVPFTLELFVTHGNKSHAASLGGGLRAGRRLRAALVRDGCSCLRRHASAECFARVEFSCKVGGLFDKGRLMEHEAS